MKRIMGVLLIILGLVLGYWGYSNYQGSDAGGVKIGELEIEAENSTSREKAYILLGAGALSFILGVYLVAVGRVGDEPVQD